MESEPRHIPVLLQEVLGLLRPDQPGVYVDGTVGLGGHSEAILRQGHPQARLLGFDRDAESLQRARVRLEPWSDRLTLEHRDFRDGPEALKKKASPAESKDGCWIWESAPSTWIGRSGGSPSRRRDPST